MCGINGFNWSDKPTVRKMNELTRNRGPDNQGMLVDSRVSLGHTRLSILDLSKKGNQPMHYGGNLAIVFNGEIYNYKELRRDLERDGYRFDTNTDTEVILAGYDKYSFGVLQRLQGMFAFCIYDRRNKSLFLARDRVGIKPFFYHFKDGKFVFSSDVKPILLVIGAENVTINEQEISNFLTYKRTFSQSLFNEIHICPPGSYLHFDLKRKELKITKYFDIVDSLKKQEPHAYERSLDTLDSLMKSAVERHLISDAKVGVVCSGGMDSSLVTALSAKAKPDIEVFFVNVADPSYSELEYVKQVVQQFGLKLNTVDMTREIFIENLVDMIYYNEIPLTHPNSVGIYLISKKARETGCKVLLTGEGADELFGGYIDRYTTAKLAKRTLSLLLKTKKASRLSALALHDSLINLNDMRMLKFGTLWLDNLRWKLKNKGVSSEAEQEMIMDLYDYLQPILIRQDKMSMAASIESRVPFLDDRLIEFATNLPVDYKLSISSSKRILRDLAKRYLPDSIINRKKVGFAIPIDQWVKVDPRFFEDGFLLAHFGIDQAYLAWVLENKSDLSWQLLNLEIWGRLFIFHENKESVRKRLLHDLVTN